MCGMYTRVRSHYVVCDIRHFEGDLLLSHGLTYKLVQTTDSNLSMFRVAEADMGGEREEILLGEKCAVCLQTCVNVQHTVISHESPPQVKMSRPQEKLPYKGRKKAFKHLSKCFWLEVALGTVVLGAKC